MFSDEPVYLKTIRVNGQEKEVKAQLLSKTFYNQYGNIIYMQNKGGMAFLFFYDEEGRRSKIISNTDRNGLYWYEYNNQTKEIEYNEDLDDETTFKYDENGNCIQEIYALSGMIIDFEYDEQGNKIKEVQKIKGKIVDETKYEYDENNNLIREVANNTSELIGKYDKKNRLIRQTQLNNNIKTYEVRYRYDDKNNVTIITFKGDAGKRIIKTKRNSNGDKIYEETEVVNSYTKERGMQQREYYYDEKQNLLFTVEKNGDKITTHYYENYYDNDKLIYQMKYLIVE